MFKYIPGDVVKIIEGTHKGKIGRVVEYPYIKLRTFYPVLIKGAAAEIYEDKMVLIRPAWS